MNTNATKDTYSEGDEHGIDPSSPVVEGLVADSGARCLDHKPVGKWQVSCQVELDKYKSLDCERIV